MTRANNEVDASTSSLASGDHDGAVCYLCLDGGVDESGQPLRRDCACRGTDAGFVHLSCLADYAETKSKQARTMKEFVTPWIDCPSCHQEYQNELSIDIATEFVSFVRRQYPDNTQRQVESLHVKLRALIDMFDRLQPVQKRETGVTADVVLSLIDRMKNESPLTRRYSFFAAIAHNVHGRIAFAEGTDESAKRAVVHFEKCLEVSKVIGRLQNQSMKVAITMRSCWRHPENCTKCVLLNWGKSMDKQFMREEIMLLTSRMQTVGMRQGNC